MSIITINENTVPMLSNLKDSCINSNHSDAIRHLNKSTRNLCQYCDGLYGFSLDKDDVIHDYINFVLLKGKPTNK